jgi:hypothetical protein
MIGIGFWELVIIAAICVVPLAVVVVAVVVAVAMSSRGPRQD